jgi:hypothetical protein
VFNNLASHAVLAQLVKNGVPCCRETDFNMSVPLDCAMKQLKPIDVLMPCFLRIRLGSLLSLSESSFHFSNIINSELPRQSSRTSNFLEISILFLKVILHLPLSYFTEKNYFLKVKCAVERV